MLIRNFFRHTVKCFKAVFSAKEIYHKPLEAIPICESHCCTIIHKSSSSFGNLDELYSNERATRKKKKVTKNKVKIQDSDPNVRKSDRKALEIELGGDRWGNGRETAEVRGGVVVEKLKEMKMMEEINSEHLMDIEETMYCYSLIASQTYKEIVDKFFVDLYCEFSVGCVQPCSGG